MCSDNNQPEDGLTTTETPDAYLAQYDGFEEQWLSTSALSCLMSCGVCFQKKYIERQPECVHVRQCAGLGAHKGRQVNLTSRVDEEEYLPVAEVLDAARDDVNHRMTTSDYAETSEFEGMGADQARGVAVDFAVEMAETDYHEFQLSLVPEAVELSIAVRFPGLSRVIVGTVDDLMPDKGIVDLKTGKRAYGEARAKNGMGLTTYGMLVFAKYGIVPPYYEIQNVVRAKTKCTTNVYQVSKTKEELERQLRRFLRACEVIDSGMFIPCNPEDWKCSPEWCAYWQTCEFGGGRL